MANEKQRDQVLTEPSIANADCLALDGKACFPSVPFNQSDENSQTEEQYRAAVKGYKAQDNPVHRPFSEDEKLNQVYDNGKTLKLGDSGQEVKKIKLHLQSLGYDIGAIDDVFDQNLEKTIMLVQTQQGILVDGKIGPQTLRGLDYKLQSVDQEEIHQNTCPTSPLPAKNVLLNDLEKTIKTLLLRAIDEFIPDTVNLTLAVEFGECAILVVGQEVMGGTGLQLSLFIDPTSPDFGKVSVNPFVQATVGAKVGKKGELSAKPQGVIGLGYSEYKGNIDNATAEGIPGTSFNANVGIEGQALVEGQFSASSGLTVPDKTGNSWESSGASLSLGGGAGAGGALEFSASTKTVFDGWTSLDLLSLLRLRKHHQDLRDKIKN